MSKHPRTDAAYKNGRYSGKDFYDFACEMEAELAAANERAVTAERNGTVTMEELGEMRDQLADTVAYAKREWQRAESAERQRDEMLVALNLGKRQAGESPVQTIIRLNNAGRRAEENARDAETWRYVIKNGSVYFEAEMIVLLFKIKVS